MLRFARVVSLLSLGAFLLQPAFAQATVINDVPPLLEHAEQQPKMHIFCRWFGLFCPRAKGSGVAVSSAASGVASCPTGTVSGKATCDQLCALDGGICQSAGNDCHRCVVLTCPSGTTKNECPSHCSGGCDVVGEQDGVTCYQCKKSCEDVCDDAGYTQADSNWNDYISGYISDYRCVSGVTFHIPTRTIGSCSCTKQPSVMVDQTVPSCAGTVCGEVLCGQSATCTIHPQKTVSVHCTWKGWENIGENQFTPIIGQ